MIISSDSNNDVLYSTACGLAETFCLMNEYISCYGGDCRTTGKAPVVRNDTHSACWKERLASKLKTYAFFRRNISKERNE